jgi:hypothetical protein
MKTPQVPALPGMSPLGFLNPLQQDQAALARRKANAPLLASKPQQPADFGLFGDSAGQTDLVDMSRKVPR